MITSRLCLSLSLLAFTLLSTCRTNPGGGAVQDEQTDLLKEAMPQGLISFVVPSEDIGKHVEPASGSNGVPPTLNGIWWTDAKTIQFVVSFKNAVWNPKTRTASLVYLGPGTYIRRPNTASTAPHRTAVPYGHIQSFAGYDIIFNEALDQATMLVAQSQSGERVTYHQEQGDFTLHFVEDGVWRRDTPGKDSYFLRRIIDENGKKDAAFQDFLRVFGPKAQVFKSSIVLEEKSPTLKVPLRAGQETYVSIQGNEPAWSKQDFIPYVVSFKSDFPLEVQSFGNSDWGVNQSSMTPIKFLASNATSGDTFIIIKSDKDGEAELQLSRGEAALPLKLGQNSVELKAKVPSYFMLEDTKDSPDSAYRVTVQSDVPTDITYRRTRSAGRAGQKENSLWISSTRTKAPGVQENTDTIILKAGADSKASVDVRKAEMNVKKYDPIRADGVWHEAILAGTETLDFWPIQRGQEMVMVEIEELSQKKTPELYLMSVYENLDYFKMMVHYARFDDESEATPEKAYKRQIQVQPNWAALVHFGGNQQLPRSPKYRIRALPPANN